MLCFFFFFSSRRRHTRYWRDWSSDVCSSDLAQDAGDPLDARALISRRVRGVEADQPLQELRGPVVERIMHVRRHEILLLRRGLAHEDESKRDRTPAAPEAPPARQRPER